MYDLHVHTLYIHVGEHALLVGQAGANPPSHAAGKFSDVYIKGVVIVSKNTCFNISSSCACVLNLRGSMHSHLPTIYPVDNFTVYQIMHICNICLCMCS